MPSPNAAVVRACLEAWERGDFEASLSYFAEDAVWENSGLERGSYRGHAGVDRAVVEWVGAFTDYWLEYDELVEVGDTVVFLWREGGTGRASGVPVEEEGAAAFTVAEGKITAVRFYTDCAEAVAAARTSAEGPGSSA